MDLSGKLTVKHFLYKGLHRTVKSDKSKKYAVYARISLDKKQYDFRSDFPSFLSNKEDLHPEDFTKTGFLSEKEFKNAYEHFDTPIGKAIETERRVTWEVGDLLRSHRFNFTQSGARMIIAQFMHPIEYAIKEVCVSLLKDSLNNSPKLADIYFELQNGINWTSEFSVLYKLLSAISGQQISEIISKFSRANQLILLIKEFESVIKKYHQKSLNSKKMGAAKLDMLILFGGSVMIYEWKYYQLENDFAEFLKSKGLSENEILDMLSFIQYSLNRYLAGLKINQITDSIFPIPNLKPFPIRP